MIQPLYLSQILTKLQSLNAAMINRHQKVISDRRQKLTRSLGFCSKIESGHNLGCHTRLQGPDMARPEFNIYFLPNIFAC